MEDKATQVRGMFAAIASKYDLINRLLSFGRDGAWRRFAVSQCSLHPGGWALDVATGTAELALHLARHNSASRIVALDFCPDMLARARTKLAAPSTPRTLELVLGDVLSLPFPDNAFDCVTTGFALRNFASIADAFAEMTRVVKGGGRVLANS